MIGDSAVGFVRCEVKSKVRRMGPENYTVRTTLTRRAAFAKELLAEAV